MKRAFKVAFALSFLCMIFSAATLWAKESSEEVLGDEDEEEVVTKSRRLFIPDEGALSAEESVAAGRAEDEFRRGVYAFYRGAFNDAILQFERALSFRPGESIILDWLGRSYYQAGIEGAALQQWGYAKEAGYGGLLLENKMEAIRLSRAQGASIEQTRFTEIGNFSGTTAEGLIFSQPISVLPNQDGTSWVLAYGSNELLKFDTNGFITSRVRGPLNGFDRPMDVIRLSTGNLLISEYAGDRISLLDSDGGYIKSIGEKGIGEGQFLGPSYLAEDANGNIYVTDWGNARVSVFDKDGKALFSFGRRGRDFAGLKGPTGIACIGDTIFVADCIEGLIQTFDTAGNYRGALTSPGALTRPEAVKRYKTNLIVSAGKGVYFVDSQSGKMFESASSGRAPSRVTSANIDVNGNVVMTDFRNDEVSVCTRMSDIVGGLFLQVQKVDSSHFPEVTVEVCVEGRRREPLVGLNNLNFYISEGKKPVLNQTLIGAAFNDKECDLTLIIDRSIENKEYEEQLEHAVKEIASGFGDSGTMRVVSAGKIPLLEYEGDAKGLEAFNATSLKTPYTKDTALDLAIRLSGNELINARKKRAILLLTCGKVGFSAFSQYGLSDLSAYLNNNSIAFMEVALTQEEKESPEISFLVDNTQGNRYYVYRTQGLKNIKDDIVTLPSGVYQLRYTSTSDTDFGRAFVPLEVEAYLQTRSGRDEVGYFAPLE